MRGYIEENFPLIRSSLLVLHIIFISEFQFLVQKTRLFALFKKISIDEILFRDYNETIPLNDNYEIADQVSMTFTEPVLQVKDFFKEFLNYFSYFYKIYNFVKMFSFIFISLCQYFFCILLLFFRDSNG
jgi:hypothetical protein